MLRISKYCYEGTSLNNLFYTKLAPPNQGKSLDYLN